MIFVTSVTYVTSWHLWHVSQCETMTPTSLKMQKYDQWGMNLIWHTVTPNDLSILYFKFQLGCCPQRHHSLCCPGRRGRRRQEGRGRRRLQLMGRNEFEKFEKPAWKDLRWNGQSFGFICILKRWHFEWKKRKHKMLLIVYLYPPKNIQEPTCSSFDFF
jgi:hypothetical protein